MLSIDSWIVVYVRCALCRTFPPAIAVGSDEATQAAGRVQIYEYNEHSRSVTTRSSAYILKCEQTAGTESLGLT